jgi:hypothetical protein
MINNSVNYCTYILIMGYILKEYINDLIILFKNTNEIFECCYIYECTIANTILSSLILWEFKQLYHYRHSVKFFRYVRFSLLITEFLTMTNILIILITDKYFSDECFDNYQEDNNEILDFFEAKVDNIYIKILMLLIMKY